MRLRVWCQHCGDLAPLPDDETGAVTSTKHAAHYHHTTFVYQRYSDKESEQMTLVYTVTGHAGEFI